MTNRLLLTTQELIRKDVEIVNFKSKNENMKNKLKHENKLIEG